MVRAKVASRKAPTRPVECTERRDKKTVSSLPVRLFSLRPVRSLALALVLAIIGAPTLLPRFSVVDNDLWWHLKVGDWILEHSAFPHTGILSRTAADRSWAAYSWIYELLLSCFHSWFHLAGISVYGLLLTLTVAYSVFWMVRRLSGWFLRAGLLTILGCAAFLFNIFPRPAFFSMTLFTVTLTLLVEARRTGRQQLLYWLPPLFLLWANSHIQFVYGLFVVGLFVAVCFLQQLAAKFGFAPDFLPAPSMPVRPLLMMFAGCVLATCVGPYSYHLYSVVFGYATAKFPYAHIREFQALGFRGYSDFVQLLLTGLGFFSLGRQKRLDPFLIALLLIASIVGYRTQRDSWFICIPAAACIALGFRADRPARDTTVAERAGIAAALALLIYLYARGMGFNSANLRLAVANVYPAHAINFLHAHPQPGPLYNTFNWGGFISWYMPEHPVAIDGRTDLYGDDIDTRFWLTESGDLSHADDPDLNQAKLVLLPRQSPLAYVLAADSHFDLIYQDSLAVVFVRR